MRRKLDKIGKVSQGVAADRPCGDTVPHPVAIRRLVNDCGVALSPQDRLAVHAAIANSALEGYQPTPDAIALLVEFASGQITIEQYQAHVLDQLGSHDQSDEPG